MVTAAPHVLSALDKCRLQHVLLKEIIDDVNGMKGKVVKEVRYIHCVGFSSAERFKHE